MLPSTEANDNTKYFTHEWTITVPTRPGVKYVHLTPRYLDKLLALDMEPTNHPFDERYETKKWDEAAIDEFMKRKLGEFKATLTKFDKIDVLVEVDDDGLAGCVQIHQMANGANNIGMMFSEKSRGKGLGKLSMQVLIQLARNLGIGRLETGTMKNNVAMRKLMESLGIPEKEQVVRDSTGKFVVAEVLFPIPETVPVAEIDMHVEFGEQVTM